MAKELDPYYAWLGIPPEERPIDFYQLLGVRRFESNTEVISNASDQRLAHVRKFQTGPNSALSQRILNELSQATRILLDPGKKQQYDSQLKARSKSSSPAAVPSVPQAVASQVVNHPHATATRVVPVGPNIAVATPASPYPTNLPVTTSPAHAFSHAQASSGNRSWLFWSVIGLSLGSVLGLISVGGYFLLSSLGTPTPEPVAKSAATATDTASITDKVATKPAAASDPVETNDASSNNASSNNASSPPIEKKLLPKPDLLRPIPVGSIWKFMDSKPGWFNTFHKISERKWIYKDDDGLEFEMEELGSNEQGISIKDWSQVNTFPVVFNDEQCTFTSVRTGRRVLKGGWVLDANDAEMILAEFTASRTSSRPPDSMIEYKERGDVIFAVNHRWGGKILLESPTPLFMEGQPCTLEYWFRRQDSPRSSIPFLRMGDVNVYLAHRGADSGGELSLSTRAGGGGSYVPLIEEWHHVIVQMDENNWIQAWLDTRRGQFPARSFSPFQDIKTYQPVEIGPGFRQKGDELFLQGEIRSLRFVRQALYKEKRPVALAYHTFSHGIKLPHDVVLKLVNVDIKQPIGTQVIAASPTVTPSASPTPPDSTSANTPSTPTRQPSSPPVIDESPELSFKTFQRYQTYRNEPLHPALPSEAEIATAKQSVQTVFGEDFKKSTKPPQKVELAGKLQRAAETEKDGKVLYVLLMEARRLCLEANELIKYFELLGELERHFPTDRIHLVNTEFPQFSMLKLSVEEREKGALELLRVARTALGSDQTEIAKNLATLAIDYVKVSRETEMKNYVRWGQEQVQAALDEYASAQASLEKIKTDPHDPAANLAVARFHAFVCGKFTVALPFFLKCGDEKFSKAAELSATAETKLQGAEAWLSIAEKMKTYEKLAIEAYVHTLYRQLKDTSSGIILEKVQQKYQELSKQLAQYNNYLNPTAQGSPGERMIPGYIFRMFVGASKTAKPAPTPYVAIINDFQDLERLNLSKYAAEYQAPYHMKIIGYIEADKSQRIRLSLKQCKIRIGGNRVYETDLNPLNTSLTVEAGTHEVMITSSATKPEFQILRSDTNDNAVGYTRNLLQSELQYLTDLPNGRGSVGVRIDN